MAQNTRSAIFQAGSYLVKAQKLLAVVSGIALAFLMTAQVIFRYWLHLPILGVEEASVLLGLWLYFLGASYITWTDEHIRGGISYLFLKSAKGIAINCAIVSIICVTVSFTLSYYATDYLISVLESGRASIYLRCPTVIWVFSMEVGFVSTSIYLAILSIRNLMAMMRELK